MEFWGPVFAASFLLAVVPGIYVFRRASAWPALDRVAAACLPGGGVAVLALLAGCLGWMLSFFYNYPRLTPSVALWFGYDLYYGLDDGPILNTIYAPMTAVVYLPSGLGRDPTSAMAIAFGVNLLLFLAPVTCFFVWIGRQRAKGAARGAPAARKTNTKDLNPVSRPDRRRAVRLGWAAVFFVTASVCYEPSRCLLEWTHAEAPALAFGALACFFVYRAAGESDWKSFLLSSLFAVLAVWSKQVAVPILAALPLFVWLGFGRRGLARYVACLVPCGLVVSGLLLLTFGFQETLLNIWTIPGRHGFGVQGLTWLGIAWQLAMAVLPILCLIAFALFVDVQDQDAPFRSLRAWLLENRWTVLLLTGICMLPVSLLGRARVGGDDNAFHSVYYFILAATLLLAEMAVGRSSPRTQKMSVMIMMLAAMVHFVFAALTVKEMEKLAHPSANDEHVAYRYAVAHPGEAYFPRCPLAGLLAEKKLYHFNGGVEDRIFAGFAPGEPHFRAYLPERFQYVAFPPDMTEIDTRLTMKYLPEFNRTVELPELPEWTVFARGDPEAGPRRPR